VNTRLGVFTNKATGVITIGGDTAAAGSSVEGNSTLVLDSDVTGTAVNNGTIRVINSPDFTNQTFATIENLAARFRNEGTF